MANSYLKMFHRTEEQVAIHATERTVQIVKAILIEVKVETELKVVELQVQIENKQ